MIVADNNEYLSRGRASWRRRGGRGEGPEKLPAQKIELIIINFIINNKEHCISSNMNKNKDMM